MNIRYPIYEGVYRILTIRLHRGESPAFPQPVPACFHFENLVQQICYKQQDWINKQMFHNLMRILGTQANHFIQFFFIHF